LPQLLLRALLLLLLLLLLCDSAVQATNLSTV
jgi:hypothetical protein